METSQLNFNTENKPIIKKLLNDKQLNGKCGLFAEITLLPNKSIDYHIHHNESETYYILSGKGLYNDNGTERYVTKGDVTFTPNGYGHGMKNALDNEPLIFMALKIND